MEIYLHQIKIKVKEQKIIIADNNKYFREGLKAILQNIDINNEISEAKSGNEVVEQMYGKPADIVFVEVFLDEIDGMEVTLSEPILVRRSRWYCWFPSLIHQPHGTLWAVISAYADIHVSDSICYLSRSRDGGVNWEEPKLIGDAGLNHLVFPDGKVMVLPYCLRPRPDGAIGACRLG